MMNKVDSRASDESVLWVTLQRDQAEGQSIHAAVAELVEAIAAFLGDWISPLVVGVRVESCDPANYYLPDDDNPPERPAWCLRRRLLDERLLIQAPWIDSQERQADSIGAPELSSLVDEALAQPAPLPDREVTLVELLIPAVEVALPEGIELKLVADRTAISPVLIQHGTRRLAQGPDNNLIGPPVAIRASNHYGSAKIVIELFWDFWLEHPAGLAQVHAAVARVLARGHGWVVTEGNLPPPASRDVPS
jgi:hypothetical protein